MLPRVLSWNVCGFGVNVKRRKKAYFACAVGGGVVENEGILIRDFFDDWCCAAICSRVVFSR